MKSKKIFLEVRVTNERHEMIVSKRREIGLVAEGIIEAEISSDEPLRVLMHRGDRLNIDYQVAIDFKKD